MELEGIFSIIKVKGRLTPYPFDPPPAIFYSLDLEVKSFEVSMW
jgi:hypothetical protein